MHSDDVLNEQFRPTKFRVGYDQREVDTFLDRVVDTLRHYESGAEVEAPLTKDHVERIQFAPTRYRQGYDPQDVDQFLDRLAVAFQKYEAEHTPETD